MNAAAGLVDGTMTPGVYRVLGEPTTINTELSAAGWRTAVVPTTQTTRDFYAAIAAALGFGASFGANLDALWDSLTDLDRPTAVILVEWHRFARARPQRWAAILSVFIERSAQPTAFALVLV